MSRILIESFEEKEISRIFIARNVQEAKQAEEILTNNSVDYAISLEPYLGGWLFPRELMGAAFYVLSGQKEFCKKTLGFAGLFSGIVED